MIQTCLGCAKFALRGLAQCLAKEYQAFGVHVAHVIVDGLTGDSRFQILADRCFMHYKVPTFFFMYIMDAEHQRKTRTKMVWTRTRSRRHTGTCTSKINARGRMRSTYVRRPPEHQLKTFLTPARNSHFHHSSLFGNDWSSVI